MSQVIKRAQARRDLVDLADYISQSSPAASARFLAAAEQACADLAAMPGMGSPWESSSPHLQGVRTWPIRGFRKYLIFYRAVEGGIEVMRVLYGARDLDAALEEEA